MATAVCTTGVGSAAVEVVDSAGAGALGESATGGVVVAALVAATASVGFGEVSGAAGAFTVAGPGSEVVSVFGGATVSDLAGAFGTTATCCVAVLIAVEDDSARCVGGGKTGSGLLTSESFPGAVVAAGLGSVFGTSVGLGVALVADDAGGWGLLPVTIIDGAVGGAGPTFGSSDLGFSWEIGDPAVCGSAGNAGNSTGHGGMATFQPMNSPFRARNTVTKGMRNLRCAE